MIRKIIQPLPLLLLMFALGTVTTRGQETRWLPIDLPDGETVAQLHLLDSGDLLAVTGDESGRWSWIYRSTDDGRSWHHWVQTKGEIWPEAVSSKGTFYLSGQTWVGPFMTSYLKFSMVSADVGRSWRHLDQKAPAFYPRHFYAGDRNRVFADTNHGLYKTDDDGITWKEVHPSRDSSPVYFLSLTSDGSGIIAGSSIDSFYLSVDNGDTWTKKPIEPAYRGRLAFQDRNTFGSVVDSSFYYTSDGGLHWMINPLPLSPAGVNVVGTNRGRFYLGSRAGVYVTRDGGQSWSHSGNNQWVNALQRTASGEMLAGTMTGIYRLESDTTWSESYAGLDSRPQRFLSRSNGDLVVATLQDAVYRSRDGGAAWEDLHFPFPGTTTIRDIQESPDRALLVSGAGALYRWMEAGGWTRLVSRDIESFTMTPTGIIVAKENNSESVLRSTNGGLNWEESSFPEYDVSIQKMFSDAQGVIFAGGYPGLYRTKDQGITWEKILDGYPHVFHVSPEGWVWFYGGGRLYHSSDSGDNWDTFDIPSMSYGFVASPENHLFMSTMEGHIYRSTDGATSWSKVDTYGIPDRIPEPPNNEAGLDSFFENKIYLQRDTQGFLWARKYESLYRSEQAIATGWQSEPDAPSLAVGITNIFPDPVQTQAEIRFTLSTTANVRLSLFDVLGRELRILANATFSYGTHEIPFPASTLPDGVYFVRMMYGNRSDVARLIVRK